MVGERVGRHRRTGNGDIPVVAPTRERLRHGVVEHHVETVTYDADGRAPLPTMGSGPSSAWHAAVSFLTKRAAAAKRFRGAFHIGSFAGAAGRADARADRFHHLPQDLSFRAERARQRVYEAVQAVGQPGGSCLWHVFGLEESLKIENDAEPGFGDATDVT